MKCPFRASRLLPSLFLCLVLELAYAQPGIVLETARSPRAQALGGNATALGGEPDLSWGNPAAPATDGARSLSVQGEVRFQEDRGWYAHGSIGVSKTAFFLGVSGFSTGSITTFAADGTPRTFVGQAEYLVSLGVTQAILQTLRVGATVKYLRSELAEQFTSSAGLLDIGIHGEPFPMVQVGAVLANVGTSVRPLHDEIDMPMEARIGVAILPLSSDTGPSPSPLVLADVVYLQGDRAWMGDIGVEYPVHPRLAVRFGAFHDLHRISNAGVTAGLGISYARFDFAYAARYWGQSVGWMHGIALTFSGKRSS